MTVNHMSNTTVGSQPGFWALQKSIGVIFDSQPPLLLMRDKPVLCKNKGFYLMPNPQALDLQLTSDSGNFALPPAEWVFLFNLCKS